MGRGKSPQSWRDDSLLARPLKSNCLRASGKHGDPLADIERLGTD